MKKQKILFLITKATWGGAQRYVFDLATHLPKERFDAVIAYGESGKLAKDLKAAGIETCEIPSLGRDIALVSDVVSLVQIFNCIRRTKPDVIHLNSSKAAAMGALAARILGVRKVIFTVHGWPFNEKRNLFARGAIYFISWFTAHLSGTTIVVSKSDEEQGKKMWLVKSKIYYVPIGIEPPQFLSRDEAASALSITTTVPRIVTIAELTANKGIQYAIEAIAELKRRGGDVSYSIIGDGEERERLEALAKRLDVADRVQFLGFVPDAAKYLKAFDVFLLPSIKEGMPYVLPEAAEANLPIITTTVVNPDIIGSYENIHAVPPADSSAIANAIIETTREKLEAELFPSKNHFSLSDMVVRTAEMYR